MSHILNWLRKTFGLKPNISSFYLIYRCPCGDDWIGRSTALRDWELICSTCGEPMDATKLFKGRVNWTTGEII